MKAYFGIAAMLTLSAIGCTNRDSAEATGGSGEGSSAAQTARDDFVGGSEFRVELERFADVRVLRYRVPGFETLDPKIKELLYYLYEAALSGREIIYDQKYRYNLAIKRTLEQVVRNYPGDRAAPEFQALTDYLKRVWFANGIHHHY